MAISFAADNITDYFFGEITYLQILTRFNDINNHRNYEDDRNKYKGENTNL
jgi:hypothetical protein